MSNILNSFGEAKIKFKRINSGVNFTINPKDSNTFYEMTADTAVTLPAHALVPDGSVFYIKNGKTTGTISVNTVDSTIAGRPTVDLAPGTMLTAMKSNLANAYIVLNNYFLNTGASFQWYWSSEVATTFAEIGTSIVANGGTTPLNAAPYAPSFNFTDNGGMSNYLLFSPSEGGNTQTVKIDVTASFSLSSPNSNNQLSIYLARNNVVLTETRQKIMLVNSDSPTAVSLSCNLELSGGNFIRVFIANDTALNNITLVSGFLKATA